MAGRSYKASARGSRKVNFEYGLRVRRRRNLQRTKLISLLFVPAGERKSKNPPSRLPARRVNTDKLQLAVAINIDETCVGIEMQWRL